MSKVLVFGDSIAFGAWDTQGGWVDRLRSRIARHNISTNFEPDYEVYNLGIPGETSETLLDRFEREIKTRYEKGDDIFLIIAIGINDSCFIHSKESSMVPPHTFVKNLEKLVTIARKYTSQIAFIGLTPVDESLSIHIEWEPDFSYTNNAICEYDRIIQTVAQEQQLVYIPLYNQLAQSKLDTLLMDGVHPNTSGHKKIFEIIKTNLALPGVVI